MDKHKKEIGNKKHPIRKVFLIGTIALAVMAIGIWSLTAFATTPALMIIEGTLVGASGATLIGSGVVANKIYDSSKISSGKKRATKSMEKIKELNADKSSTYTKNYRAKIVKKFANANLTLTKRLGASIYGTYHSNTGMKNEKATVLLNQIDSYTLLRDTATSNGAQKKYSKKLDLAKEKLQKLVEQEGIKTSMCKWTKSYDDVLTDVSVLDRRTEIYCLTKEARDSFKLMFENSVEILDNKALNVVLHFNKSAGLRPTVAKTEDQTKAHKVADILLNDIINACKTKESYEIRNLFPITLETKVIDKNTTKILNIGDKPQTFYSLKELKDKLEKDIVK